MDDGLRPPRWFNDGGLDLRAPTPEDVERIAEICQDPDSQRFTRVPVPYGRQDAVSFVAMATDALRGGRATHLLVQRDTAVVGCVGAGIDQTDQWAVVGFWIAAEARRHGTATTSMRRMCRWLLDELGIARLELTAATTNPGSNAVAQRLGFRLDGTRRSALLLSVVGDRPAERVDANDWGLLPGELR